MMHEYDVILRCGPCSYYIILSILCALLSVLLLSHHELLLDP